MGAAEIPPSRAVRIETRTLLEAGRVTESFNQREMALPSYTHWNPLIRWLFWARLDAALRLAHLREGESVLDFATGTGILLPTLCRTAARVACTDLDVNPPRELSALLGLRTEVIPIAGFASWASENRGRFDCVLAIDCIDHLSEAEMDEYLAHFRSLLSRQGRLIVCGPTETLAYRTGRLLAGFRNEYHHRTVFDVDLLLRKRWTRERWMRLPSSPLPAAFYVGRYRLAAEMA